jgi:hypothetical protein
MISSGDFQLCEITADPQAVCIGGIDGETHAQICEVLPSRIGCTTGSKSAIIDIPIVLRREVVDEAFNRETRHDIMARLLL